MHTRRNFIRRASWSFIGTGLLLSPLFSAKRWACAAGRKVLASGTKRESLIHENPAALDTTNLEITPLEDFGTMGPTEIYSGTPADVRIERAKGALRQVDLEPRMYHKPNELSGGQRQRVAVARALVNNPSILLADEPTGNLDTATGNEIMALFERLYQQGNTIVLVTHEHDIALHAHRVIHIRDGKVEKDERIK